jgi:hypothetical protein
MVQAIRESRDFIEGVIRFIEAREKKGGPQMSLEVAG